MISTRAYVRTSHVRSTPANADQQSLSAPKPVPASEASAASSEAAAESSNVNEEGMTGALLAC